MDPHLLFGAIKAALGAGNEIMTIYSRDFDVEYKADFSPLTDADKLANICIQGKLSHYLMPILSEEDVSHVSYPERQKWERFWLVDPLDGTKEFIKKNGEFTVNIALVQNGAPVLGVVYVPVTRVLYYASALTGSFKVVVPVDFKDDDIDNLLKSASSLPCNYENAFTYTVVASRSHFSKETEEFIRIKETEHKNVELISAGSSIKICLVAEGKANVYPRLAPTMEWDTAAGQAVAKYAGCKVYNYDTGIELNYNKEILLNPWFVVER
jgi:3'(2'), 5'-bisphosphate nucleotidase